MKAKSRRHFTSEFKVKVVLEVLRQDKTLSQITSDYDRSGGPATSSVGADLETGIYGRNSESVRSTKGSRKAG
jgi:hypothetical protein